MLSLFSLFIVELIAFRWGTARLARLGIPQGLCSVPYRVCRCSLNHIPVGCDTTSGHHHVHHEKGDEETASSSNSGPDSASAQIISVAILEFGVVLHSVLVGLTLAVDENFIILFVVLVFHRQ